MEKASRWLWCHMAQSCLSHDLIPTSRTSSKGKVDKGPVDLLVLMFFTAPNPSSPCASRDGERGFCPSGSPILSAVTLRATEHGLDSPFPILLLPGEEHQGSKGMSPQQGSLGCLGSVPDSAPQVGSAPAPAPSPHGVSPQGHPHRLLHDFFGILGKEELLSFPSFF